ncbi:MAG: hypothetical protein WAK45_08585 [Methanoregula sp.]
MEDPSRESRAFWEQCYPQIKTVEETRILIARTGYHFCADFPLPLSA